MKVLTIFATLIVRQPAFTIVSGSVHLNTSWIESFISIEETKHASKKAFKEYSNEPL